MIRKLGLVMLMVLVGGIVAAQNSPAGTVENFLRAWNNQDYPTMYSLLSPQSQEMYPYEAFEARYRQTAEIVTLTGVTFTLGETRTQGMTAAIAYDVVLQTSAFGDIDDPGRTMRVAQESGRWGIAWSTMDIFAMLAEDTRLSTGSSQNRRATIYDRTGRPIAQDGGEIVSLYSSHQRMAGVDDCKNLLTDLMRDSRRQIDAVFQPFSFNTETVFFMGWLNGDIYAANRDRLINICGIQEGFSSSQQIRTYFGGNAMMHVLGYVGPIPADQLTTFQARGYSQGDQVGLLGVERAYQDVLAGQPERVLRILEPGGTVLREFASAAGTDPVPIGTTIDSRLQVIVADALNDAFNYAAGSWAAPGIATGAAAVVLDVNTGGVLALASYPTANPVIFNQNVSIIENRGDYVARASDISRRALLNRATQDQFFPGSVYKIITIAAALNEGLMTPETIFDCQLEWEGTSFGDQLASRADWRLADGLEAAGQITPAQALMASCNPFFYESGARLFNEVGAGTLDEYARRMGLGQVYRVNESLQGIAGTLGNPPSVTAAINNAIGQDPVQLPPIQMAVATAAIANGGTVYDPFLVQQIGGYENAPVQQTIEPQVLSTLDFNPGVMETIQQGMCGVPIDENYGTATWVFEGATYSVCGKTGTAQSGTYPNAWFVAYSPAQNPEVAIVVTVPQSREGSEIAAPIVRRILDDYYGAQRAEFPEFWLEEYVPLNIPEGSTAG